ncbi:MAG: flagellar motor switch protein FliG, partial [Rhizobiaceae bacterium]
MSLNLTRPQKAAAILVAMGKPAAGRLLKFFKQDELKALIDGARMLRTIPQGELERIVGEFEAEFAEGAGLLDSADTMDTILNESFTPEEMKAILGQDQPKPIESKAPPPVWPSVEKLEAERVGAFLANEHPQTIALVLSNMSPQPAANALMTLAKPLRGEVVKRMLAMNNVPEQAKRIVEDQIRTRMLAENTTKDTTAGQIRVAGVLNELDKEDLEEVISEMQAAGTSDLEAIRARLFNFDDIVQLSQKSRVALFDGLSTDLVTLALRGCEPALAEAILSALGPRSRRMIESELASEAGNIPFAEIARARKNIASTAIRLASEGAVQLPGS